MFKNRMDPYIELLLPYQKTIDVSSYKKCMKLFRTLSKINGYKYTYKMRYVNSTYYIDYYFFT